MKILHVISTLASRAGGPSTTLSDLSRYEARQGLDVNVCTTNSDCPNGTLAVAINQAVETDGVTTIYHAVQFRPLLFSMSMARWLRTEISRFDIVHIHGLYRFPQSYAAWCARQSGVPYLMQPHGALDPFLYRQSSTNLPLKRLYERLIDFPNLNHADAICYTSQDEMERAAFLRLKARPVIVPNGLDWDDYRQLPPRGQFRESLGIGPTQPLILFLGRLNFKKGLDLLIPAFADVSKPFADARLAIVGPDNEGLEADIRDWCQQAGVLDKVLFAGHLNAEQVRQAYVDADVFVLPSYTENFGMTVIEALACRLPVVISDQVNIHREIQQASAGLVTGLDAGEVSAAICKLLANPELAAGLGAAGRKFVHHRYCWDTVTTETIDAYQEILRGHRQA